MKNSLWGSQSWLPPAFSRRDALCRNTDFITVPNGPRLEVTLNEEIASQHLLEPGFMEPTTQWNTDRSNDRLWS
jgi:hypothetical protein